MKTRDFHVLVVGGGPAGLSAALHAARHGGVSVGLVDDNAAPGGQIWRGRARQWSARLRACGVEMLPGTRVIAPAGERSLLAEAHGDTVELRYDRLVLATGARELFLPFPGWTLPGAMGAGGLQALVKGGLPVKGKRVVVAGSGPLLLAVAAYLKSKGANVPLVAEQASLSKLAAFVANLARYPEKLAQAAGLARHLRGTPFRAGAWVTEAHGANRLEAVTVHTPGGTPATVPCDYLACGFGLVSNTELAAALGCCLKGSKAAVDRWQRTSLEGVYCAGEVTGIGGVKLSLAEGRIAGLAAVGLSELARHYFPERARARRFAALLDRTFALRDELRWLANDDTVVCRCEDVTCGQMREHPHWRAAKLQTRCGMGPCQGRVCGAAAGFLFGWTHDSVRPPIAPARVDTLANIG